VRSYLPVFARKNGSIWHRVEQRPESSIATSIWEKNEKKIVDKIT